MKETVIFYYIYGKILWAKYSPSGPLKPIKTPAVTVCVYRVKKESGVCSYARGVSICSAKDTPCKYEGRNQAQYYAFLSLPKAENEAHFLPEMMYNSMPIQQKHGYVRESFDKYGVYNFPFDFKSSAFGEEYLTPFEKRIFEKIDEKESRGILNE